MKMSNYLNIRSVELSAPVKQAFRSGEELFLLLVNGNIDKVEQGKVMSADSFHGKCLDQL